MTVNGRAFDGWTVAALPDDLRAELMAVQKRERFATLDAMLAAAPRRYEPPLPRAEIAEHCWRQAAMLQHALAPSLARMHAGNLNAAEFERRGVSDYAEHFGQAVSPRHWRALFKRVCDRDGGREQWDNAALYLPERLARKTSPAPASGHVDGAAESGFADIITRLAACADPGAPNEAERAGIWELVFTHYDRLVKGRGQPAKRARRLLCDFIAARAPVLAPTRDALLKAFLYKLAKRTSVPTDAKALRDERRHNSGNHDGWELPEADRDLVIARAVFKYRGDILPAWQDLLRGGDVNGEKLTTATIARYAGKSKNIYHVPASIRDSIRAEVEIQTILHQSPRAFDAIKGYVRRNYDGIASLRCMMADDFTMPVYFYVPDGTGWFNLVRGQCLVFIDFRSLCVLGWSLQPERNYSSLTIRSQCTTVFEGYNVPDVLYFERGIWESSSLLKGRTAPCSTVEISQGLRELGIEFIHAIRPRSKTVERVGGILQDLMEAEPGYCGRDERRDCPEATRQSILAVERALNKPPEEREKFHPARLGFLSYDQWNTRLREIINQYNARPQGGHILDGRSPDAALEEFRDLENAPTQFGPGFRFLFATQKEIRPVTLNGVTLRIGKTSFTYRGAAISHLVGREVLLWFDPENPEFATITDLDRRNPVCVERSESPNALESFTAPDSGTLARELARIEGQASYMKARFNVIKRKFALKSRPILADADTIELGRQIAQRTDAAHTEKRQRVKAQRLAREIGMALPLEARFNSGDVDDLARVRDFLREHGRAGAAAQL